MYAVHGTVYSGVFPFMILAGYVEGVTGNEMWPNGEIGFHLSLMGHLHGSTATSHFFPIEAVFIYRIHLRDRVATCRAVAEPSGITIIAKRKSSVMKDCHYTRRGAAQALFYYFI